ncbi:MAG: hypothetical protein ACPG8W_10160 [Candidatus Promineifilaceae bacterium]
MLDKDRFIIHATVKIQWRLSDETGKLLPPRNSDVLAMTASPINHQNTIFSVVVVFEQADCLNSSLTGLHFLAPDIVFPLIESGSRIFMMDGAKVLGEAEFVELYRNRFQESAA